MCNYGFNINLFEIFNKNFVVSFFLKINYIGVGRNR